MHISPVRRLFFSLLAVSGRPALAAEPAWLGDANCRIAPFEPAPPKSVRWKGACVDGYASGKGVLALTLPDMGEEMMMTIEASLVRGAASGEALVRWRDFIYEGTTRNWVPHGQGYLQYGNGGGWYEGEFAHGRPHGKGTRLKVDRSRYTGEWVQGKLHGRGEASFATGGSYAGEWKNDAFDGQGSIVYAGAGHKYEGLFRDGRVAGLPEAEVAKGLYRSTGGMRGSPGPDDGITSELPMQARWDALTPAQKNTFRKHYPALEAGDEPPFPAEGQGPLLDKVYRMNQTFGAVTGDLSVLVLVGKDGKPLSVTAFGAPTATLVRALSTLLMLEPFKPALCRGAPCEMVYPINFRFSVAD